jgi:hypothetical protein
MAKKIPLSDLHEVIWREIIFCYDEQFALAVGNDTEKRRKKRYGKMRCTISATCSLSENSMRILERMFGYVVVEAKRRL